MTTIIRRYRRRRAARFLPGIAAAVAVAVPGAWLLAVIWHKGGPQPVHAIVTAIPAPQTAPSDWRRA